MSIYLLILAGLLSIFSVVCVGIILLSSWLDRHPPPGGYPPRWPGVGSVVIETHRGVGPIKEP